jgi:3-hydroxyisobutyrate dehydrogenase-like beta-hydroxyacid dehydrogenase
MARGAYEPATMKGEIWQKDMKIIADFASGLDCPTPLFATSAAYYTAALAQGYGGQDTAAVCAVLEVMAGHARDPAREFGNPP